MKKNNNKFINLLCLLFLILMNKLKNFSNIESENNISNIMQDLAFAIPGIDEAISFAEVMKYVKKKKKKKKKKIFFYFLKKKKKKKIKKKKKRQIL